jgi:ABC-type sugar transport system substrate-binding protein
MKKLMLCLLVIVLTISMAATFSLIGCKKEAAETSTAEGTAAAETTAAEETTAATATVAEDKELYLMPCGVWGLELMQPYWWGGVIAAKYFDVGFERLGPDDWDVDKMLEALEIAIAKKPTGILWAQLYINEGPLLTAYHESGGLIASMHGTDPAGEYPVDFIAGTDHRHYGEQQGKWLLDNVGKEKLEGGTIGIVTPIEAVHHIIRVEGIKSALKDVNVKIELIDHAESAEVATQNVSTFLAANPDVVAIIGTGGYGASAAARALKEAGYNMGDVTVLGADMDADLLDLIEQGWVAATLAQSFAVDTFYAIATLHFLHNNVIHVTGDDTLAGILPAPAKIVQNSPFITKENIAAFRKMSPPEGAENFIK